MGRHPHTRYISPKPKKALKMGQLHVISTSACAPPLIASRSPKMVKHDQGSSKLRQGPT
jgi:hypothetical protein